jgi:hypothetical protein
VLILHAYGSRTAIKFFSLGILPPNLEELTMISPSGKAVYWLGWYIDELEQPKYLRKMILACTAYRGRPVSYFAERGRNVFAKLRAVGIEMVVQEENCKPRKSRDLDRVKLKYDVWADEAVELGTEELFSG